MLFLTCPEAVLQERLLTRGRTSDRVDDNLASIVLRLETFRVQTLPVKQWAADHGKLHEVECSGSVEAVFGLTSAVLAGL